MASNCRMVVYGSATVMTRKLHWSELCLSWILELWLMSNVCLWVDTVTAVTWDAMLFVWVVKPTVTALVVADGSVMQVI